MSSALKLNRAGELSIYASSTSSPSCARANCTTSSTPGDSFGGSTIASDNSFWSCWMACGSIWPGVTGTDTSCFSDGKGKPSPIWASIG